MVGVLRDKTTSEKNCINDFFASLLLLSHSNLKMEIIKGISGFTSVTLEKKCMNEKPRPNFDTPELHSPNVFISYFFFMSFAHFFQSYVCKYVPCTTDFSFTNKKSSSESI